MVADGPLAIRARGLGIALQGGFVDAGETQFAFERCFESMEQYQLGAWSQALCQVQRLAGPWGEINRQQDALVGPLHGLAYDQ